jgi:MoaA/NifB/PqqE/SkfB family radical SAM enzyme
MMPPTGNSILQQLPFRITFGPDLVRNFAGDVVKARLAGRFHLRPLVLAYFVTFRCNMSCSYCKYSTNSYASRYPEVDTAGARRILRICREGVPSVGFTGGEPLLREDIVDLTAYAQELGYAPVTLFTNSILLPKREGIFEHVDFLQISLDTLDENKQDHLNGGKDVVRRVRENIRRYAPMQRKLGFRINLNCVVGPENIDDVESLMAYATQHDIRFSIAPRLDEQGVPVEALFREPERTRFRCVMDRVIEHKKKTNKVVDIVPFLEHLRDFRPARCHPEVSARVYADGSLIHPCPNYCNETVDVLTAGSWKDLQDAADNRNPVPEHCERPCFLPCYLETSLLVRYPLSLLRELRG